MKLPPRYGAGTDTAQSIYFDLKQFQDKWPKIQRERESEGECVCVSYSNPLELYAVLNAQCTTIGRKKMTRRSEHEKGIAFT